MAEKHSDNQEMLRAIANLARVWFFNAGISPGGGVCISRSFIAGCRWHDIRIPEEDARPDAIQRAFLAAGCDLVDVLCLFPDGRQALRDLGFEPIRENAEAECQ